MSTTATEGLLDQEQLNVESWRAKRFERMGCPWQFALELSRTTIDLHRFEELLRHGCSREIAADILR